MNCKIGVLVVFFGVLCTLIVASGAREVGGGSSAAATSETWLGDGYGNEIQEIVGIFSDLMNQTFASGFPWLRQAHAKQHGCAQAIVTPLAGLNETLAQGVFATPEPVAAFIRFSNGVGRGFAPPGPIKANESDIVPDIRGFAVKLVNVTTDEPFLEPNANTQVFTLTTDHQGFLPDVATALSFFKAIQSGLAEFAAWSAANPESAVLFFKQAVIIDDLLTADWFSPVPSRHGDTFVKHHIYNPSKGFKSKPRKLEGPSPKFGFDFNYLTDQLIADLDPDYQDEGYNLRWAVQLYVDDYETPVNDSTIVWEVPFVDIADIYIPPQNSFNDAQNSFCTYMSFNPGFSIATHAPYGPIQEIRMAVYQAMATLRHALQGQPNTDATYQDWLNFPALGA